MNLKRFYVYIAEGADGMNAEDMSGRIHNALEDADIEVDEVVFDPDF